MALTTAAAVTAASMLSAMYLDAKLLIRHDLTSGALSAVTNAAMKYTAQRVAEDRMTVYHDLKTHAESTYGDKRVFLMFEGQTWTYRKFFMDVQRVGNWLMKDLGVERGEIVALNGPNSPEHLMVLFGLDAIGAVPALINCNLTAGPLVHCIKVGQTRYLLADRDVSRLVDPTRDELTKSGCQTVYYDSDFVAALEDTTDLPLSRIQGAKSDEIGTLMYTSGTTGMPKGIKMPRAKGLNTSRGVALYLGLKPGNKIYTCLPLYHGAAHGLCITPTVYAGSTVVLSRKFSHKTFWPEVRESKADILQYVGELCRYLVNGPPSPLDKKHNVTMAWGNGMRPDVWEVFRERFGIPVINELYAATDGMGGSFNYNRGEFGRSAIAKRGAIWKFLNGSNEKRVKIDPVTQEILRDENGFATVCKAGEAGETVVRLIPGTEKLAFAGYFNNEEASAKRMTRNVSEKGDLWFRTGDMMRMDADGCVYFVDRLGDTYRWKSENVSTNEVGDVMGSFDQIAEANVYGVQVPNADGRCGCAAIVLVDGLNEQQLNLDKLAKHAISTLPRYAVPVFVRVVKELHYTGTMKVQKGKMREEGIDLDKLSADSSKKDSMYWLPPGKSSYVPFGRKDWDDLNGGRVRL